MKQFIKKNTGKNKENTLDIWVVFWFMFFDVTIKSGFIIKVGFFPAQGYIGYLHIEHFKV